MQAAGAVSLGFVGEVTAVDPALLDALLEKGFLPVVAPVAIDEDGSTALNVNADTTAGAIAGAIGADAYLIVTDVARVRRDAADPNSEIARMTASEARAYLESGVFEGGMRPKVESALAALGRGAASVVIGGRGPGAIGSALSGNGTTLVAD
jgi:acetylglutamate kinase